MKKEIPQELNNIADKVLTYKPKPKSRFAKKRTRRTKKLNRKLNV